MQFLKKHSNNPLEGRKKQKQKSEGTKYKKENGKQQKKCRPISLMNRETLNKILANTIQQYIITIMHSDQMGFTAGRQAWLNIENQWNLLDSQIKREKSHWCRKNMFKKKKTSRKTRNRGELAQINKGHWQKKQTNKKKLLLRSYLMVKGWTLYMKRNFTKKDTFICNKDKYVAKK